MVRWGQGGGFSLDASLCVEEAGRQSLERLRWSSCACAAIALALLRWREIDAKHRVDKRVKPGLGGSVSLMLTALERIARLSGADSAAALLAQVGLPAASRRT